jgi:predicted PhzF superfamily epimerase YddE/YHI9
MRCIAEGKNNGGTDLSGGCFHRALGPFWSKKLGKNEFIVYQASERGGVLRIRVAGDRVYLGGQAVTILRGELTNTEVSN